MTKLKKGSKVIVKDGEFRVVHDPIKMQLTKIDDNHYLLRKGGVKIILSFTEIDRIWRRAESIKKKKLK